MYEYKGYSIVLGKKDRLWYVYKNDKCYGCFATDKDAEDCIDNMVE